MTVEKIIPNTNILTISELNIGDGFIKTNSDDKEIFFIIIGKNIAENFCRAINLENGKENIFFDYQLVRKIDKIIIK